MNFIECKCGTLYCIEDTKKAFRCNKCKKKLVFKEKETPVSVSVEGTDNPAANGPMRMSKWIFLLGSTVGIFVLALMIPTAIFFKEPTVMVIFLILELIFGTLLVCASISFYLLTIQVKNLQSLMTFHQHNLHIFADQISKLFFLLRKRD
jgi:hypothetical protein